MKQEKSSFRHESIQDLNSITDILKAITKGLEKGELELSDEEGEITFKPEGLLTLKVTGSRNESSDRLNIRISWQHPMKMNQAKQSLKVK